MTTRPVFYKRSRWENVHPVEVFLLGMAWGYIVGLIQQAARLGGV